MVTKISLGKSLYGALAYNGEKINKEQGRLLATNRIFNDGSGTVDIAKAMEGFLPSCLPWCARRSLCCTSPSIRIPTMC